MEVNVEILTQDVNGHVVDVRRNHNIWVNNGRSYLARMISYSSLSPLTVYEDQRIRYMGLGIGSFAQTQPAIADNPPLSIDYPGTHVQQDWDLSSLRIERAIRYTPGGYLYELPIPTFDAPNFIRYTAVFGLTDISYGPYTIVPISEIALYATNAIPGNNNNVMLAYDAFPTVSKTQLLTLTVNWTVSF